MRHGSLESGIGGFDYAAQMMGWENLFHVEINPFCRTILNYYWPKAKSYANVFGFNGYEWRGKVDIITGGFPCQPFSHAGQRKGSADDRFIWPENMRIVREAQPTFCLFENVPGILTIEDGMVFEQVCADLEDEGYEVTPLIIPACATNKDHRRDRVWIVAYNDQFNGNHAGLCTGEVSQQQKAEVSGLHVANTQNIGYAGRKGSYRWDTEQLHPDKQGWQTLRSKPIGCNSYAANTLNTGLQRHEQQRASEQGAWTSRPAAKRFENENWLEAATRLCSMDDGTSGRLDPDTISKSKWRTESLKAYGNAIVWDVAYEIFQAIENSINQLTNSTNNK